MSISHHSESPEERHARELMIKQMLGSAARTWPGGRLSGEDDGATAYAVATDLKHNAIIICFPKAMNWIGLEINQAMALRDNLDKRIAELQAPRTQG